MEGIDKNKDYYVLNIVILGASFAGLAIAHKFMRQIMETLGKHEAPLAVD
jgi:hypothetical protein